MKRRARVAKNSKAVRAVVAYEDEKSRAQALRFCSRLRQIRDFRHSWWKFKYLEDPVLMRGALKEAAQADILIFSTCQKRKLPAPISRWVEELKSQRTARGGALIALLSASRQRMRERPPVQSQLHGIAREMQMDFFSQWATPLAFQPVSDPPRAIHE